MLKNYLTVALRTLRRNTTYTVVNITGLALGMTAFALIAMLVYHQWSYDRFHERADQIYRTYFEYYSPEGDQGIQTMMTPQFTEILRESFPQIERATPFVTGFQNLEVGTDVTQFRVAEVHNDFFNLFSFPLLAGDKSTVLLAPDEIVISERAAIALFAAEKGHYGDIVGKVISITRAENTYDFTVSGVSENTPAQSSIQFDAALSFENYGRLQLGGNSWGGRVTTYVQLVAGSTGATIEAASSEFVEQNFSRYITALSGAGMLAEGEGAYAMRLQPLTEMHLNPNIRLPYETPAHNPLYSYILTGIGLLILLIACINFMTLSVGQSASRAREVGVRKVLGAYRSQLMKQYFGESTILATVSLGLGVGLTVLALPWFASLAGAELSFTQVPPLLIGGAFIGLVLVVGIVAGAYPAVILSRFQPASVLKGNVGTSRKNRLTQSLVVLQYTISIALIVATGLMTQQLQFMFDKDLGYDREFVIAVEANGISRADADGVADYFKTTLLPYPQISHVSRAGTSFTRGSDRNSWADASGTQRSAYNFGVDFDYLDLMGMKMAEGRFFSEDFQADLRGSIVVNQALVDEFEMVDPVGQKLTGWLSFIYEEDPTIIGVVENFHYQDLHQEVFPAVMNMHPDYYSYMGAILVRVEPGSIAASLELIEATWNEIRPGQPYIFSFLDADIEAQYVSEQRWQTILTYSAILAIVIACMGLFGLALITVNRRTKEIGIRKVMGASVTGIATLLSKEFAFLVIVASIIAAPFAYWGMGKWLETFAFQIQIGPGIFVVASLGALFIAVATVSIHSIKAAHMNPSDTLRDE